MTPKRWIGVAFAIACGGLFLSTAFAQPSQPNQPSPQPPAPPHERPTFRAEHPMPPPFPANLLQQPPPGTRITGPGTPGGRTLPPGARPGQVPPPPSHQVRPHPRAAEAPEPERVDEENCPGHGQDDMPRPVNWWHGFVMVNNERAAAGGFLNNLLFRYENEENPCDSRNEPPPFAATVVNFAILVIVLYRFGRKPLAEALIKRKQSIMAEIDNATRLKEEAEARLAEYEEKLENIHDKLEEVRAEYAAQGEAERRHILEEAEERRSRMRRDAEFRIDQELKTARTELLREAVEKAVAGAEKTLRERIQSSDHDKIAEDYLKSIGAAVAGAAKTRALAGGAA
jgi:F-type H+-transporting ATPase subunit b